MKSLLQKLFDIRPGEFKQTFIMAGYIFIVIASYNILKPMSRSLAVSNLGLEQLPYLYISLVLVVGVFVTYYLKLSSRLQLNRLINITFLFLTINLLLFKWLLDTQPGSPVLYYVLFIWTSIYGVLTPTQFWLMANNLFNAREAKRLFPFFTTGALLGGISGGYVTRFLVGPIGGTTNLTFLCVAFLGGACVLMNLAWKYREQSFEKKRPDQPKPEQGSAFKLLGEVGSLIRNSKHLAALAGIVLITFMVVQIADFQFIAFGNETSENTDDLTRFLGFWLSNMSIIALLFQLFFAGAIIKKFGIGATILFLPVALFLSSLWVLLGYGLISILALKMGDGAFRHSINKVGMELFYLPIPHDVKKKTKAFIDMFIDRLGRGSAGVLLLIFYTWLGLSLAQISLISLTLIAIWLALAIIAYREYVNSFRTALAKRSIDTELINISIRDEASINFLTNYLSNGNERQVVYALQLLESVEGVDLARDLKPLLEHESKEVKLHTLKLIRQKNERKLLPNIEPLLCDSDKLVQREAVRIRALFSGDAAHDLLNKWFEDKQSGLRYAALFYISENPELVDTFLSPELIREFLGDEKEGRLQVVEALGNIKDKAYRRFLLEILNDSDHDVRTVAITSAGQSAAAEFIPALVQNLRDRNFRKDARQALAQYGESAIQTLADILEDADQPDEIRREIPKIFGLIGSQLSVEFLLGCLGEKNGALRYQLIKALNKIRSRNPNFKFDKRVDAALQYELNNYWQILTILNKTDSANDHPVKKFNLLTHTLKERLEDHLERSFRLLGLRYPAKDIYNAFRATTSKNKVIRANAIEFLDNILTQNHKHFLLPIVEGRPLEKVFAKSTAATKVNINSQKEALEYLVTKGDPWLQSVAIHEIGQRGLASDFKKELRQAQNEKNEIVRETAQLVLKQFD